MKRRAFLPVVAASAVLAACATPPPPPPQGWSGKLGYRVEPLEGQRPQAGSALFELHGNAQAGRLQLSSPLGTGLAEARWDADGVRLHDGRAWQGHASLADLGQALGEALQGPPLPLQALFDWLHARPWPHAAHEPQATGFVQLGWSVEWPEPQRLVLSRPAQGSSGAMQLRFLLSTIP